MLLLILLAPTATVRYNVLLSAIRIARLVLLGLISDQTFMPHSARESNISVIQDLTLEAWNPKAAKPFEYEQLTA